MRVELKNVCKRFGKFAALQDVTLAFASGSRTALVGPNGSGKSTLVRMLMGMLEGDGELTLDGLDPAQRRQELAPRIAYVPQVAPRLWANVRDLVRATVGLRGGTESRVVEIAAQLGLDLEAVALRPFRALSGGMRQKALAATALASAADLLILDEPTASMDPRSRATFHRLLDDLPQRPTVLLCSHRLEEIRRHVDSVVELAEGKIAWQGASRDWLEAHSECVVELRTVDQRAGEWLALRGFCRVRSDWWQLAVPTAQRAALVSEVIRELDDAVLDLLARDLESAEPQAVPL